MSQVRNDQKKDFVEKVNELNMRRTQAFSGGADPIPINQTFEKQNQFYQSLNHRAIDSCSNPFFETIYGKTAQMGGTLNLLKQPTSGNKLSFNAHTPSMGGLHPSVHGGAYSTMPKQAGNPLYQNMDPPQMS